MIVKYEDDFPRLARHIRNYKKRFPMFMHDIRKLESNIEQLKKEYSFYTIKQKQSKSEHYLTQANQKIEEINQVILLIDKIELMAILSRR